MNLSAFRLLSGPLSERVLDRVSSLKLIDTEELLPEAMKELEGHEVLGLNCEGVSLGRKGKLCLVQLATVDTTYIFDITALGAKAFRGGLKTILESNKITKIVHDARTDSDALYHQHKVVLTNTFDTQVADVLIRRGITQQLPRFLSGYNHCLHVYLAFTLEDTNIGAVGKGQLAQDLGLYDKRPLEEATLLKVSFNVSFLHKLQAALQKLLMLEFTTACDQYLRVKRNLSELEVAKLEASARGSLVDVNIVPQSLVESRFRNSTTPLHKRDPAGSVQENLATA